MDVYVRPVMLPCAGVYQFDLPMPKIEFFFDCSSPWTYLAFVQIQQLVSAEHITWRPFLVGGVFNTINPSVYENRANPVPAKQRYYAKDLQDWAAYVGVTIGAPPVFPVNSVKVMRGAFVADEHNLLVPYANAVFEAYWTHLQDISDTQVIAQILQAVGLEAGEFFAKIESSDYKQRLRDNTEELMQRGGFGSPTIFVDDTDMYFGNDRLQLLAGKLD